MFGATQDYIDNQWKPYFKSQMAYLDVPDNHNVSSFMNKSIEILNNDSYDAAVAYTKALTKEQVMGGGSSSMMMYLIGGGLLAASLFFLRKS